MSTTSYTPPVSKGALWTGYVISALPALALLFSAFGKFFPAEGTEQLLEPIGWKIGQLFWLGILEAAVAVVYLIPRTSVLGAILIAGYMGGAIATHLRIGDMMIVPQILIGVFVWLGLWLRDPRLRSLIPFRT